MRICVEANHKYVDEIQSVAQVFFPHARFGNTNAENDLPDCTIVSNIENDMVRTILKSNPLAAAGLSPALIADPLCLSLELPLQIRSPYLNAKRIAMLALYHLLQNNIGAYAPWGALTGVRPTKMIREWINAGQSDEEITGQLLNTFCVHEDRVRLAMAVAHAENRLAARIITGDRLGVYVSIPFCPSRCSYCSFNTAHKPYSIETQARYVQAIEAECQELLRNLRETGMSISSIYIGGGTPTALSDSLLENLLTAVKEIVHANIEYTIEAGRPDTITRSKLRIMRKYGANRISINPQTFNNRTLEAIGRNHTTQDFFRAFEMAREEGFNCINTDIIAGLPGEGPEDMQCTMEALAPLNPENITIHTLAIKRASKLNEHRMDHSLSPYMLPCAQTIKAQLQIAHEGCIAQGLFPYYLYRQKNMAALFENTGYSRPGHECLYNVGMMAELQTVLGIGAGAVSKYVDGAKITRKFNVKNPEIYIERRINS